MLSKRAFPHGFVFSIKKKISPKTKLIATCIPNKNASPIIVYIFGSIRR